MNLKGTLSLFLVLAQQSFAKNLLREADHVEDTRELEHLQFESISSEKVARKLSNRVGKVWLDLTPRNWDMSWTHTGTADNIAITIPNLAEGSGSCQISDNSGIGCYIDLYPPSGYCPQGLYDCFDENSELIFQAGGNDALWIDKIVLWDASWNIIESWGGSNNWGYCLSNQESDTFGSGNEYCTEQRTFYKLTFKKNKSGYSGCQGLNSDYYCWNFGDYP